MDLDLYLRHVSRFPVFLIAADPRVGSDGIEIAVSRHIDRSRIQIVVGLHIGTHLNRHGSDRCSRLIFHRCQSRA